MYVNAIYFYYFFNRESFDKKRDLERYILGLFCCTFNFRSNNQILALVHLVATLPILDTSNTQNKRQKHC